MRFLLSTSRRVARQNAVISSSSAETSSTSTQQNFGQQCGVNCGCVVRLELDVGSNNTVQTAKYTAKQILLDNQQRPLRTTKGRLQFQPSRCPTLHKLLPATVSFVEGKPLHKLQTYTDFAGHRSSESFGRAVLQQHGLAASNSAAIGCFDLVEDVVTAAIRGYLPGPRRPKHMQQQQQQLLQQQYTSDEDERNNNETAVPAPLQETAAGWTGLMWPFALSREEEEAPAVESRSSKWTALDWIDYWEQQHQQQEQMEQQQRQPRPKDWLSYVDLREEADKSA